MRTLTVTIELELVGSCTPDEVQTQITHAINSLDNNGELLGDLDMSLSEISVYVEEE